MKKYKYIIRKVQESIVDVELTGQETIDESLKIICDMKEDEMQFSEPEYHLVAISKEDKKKSSIIWRSKTS